MAIKLPSKVVGRNASNYVEVSNMQPFQVGMYDETIGIATDEHGKKHLCVIHWQMGNPYTTDISDPYWDAPTPSKAQITQASRHYFDALGQLSRETHPELIQYAYDKALCWLKIWAYAMQNDLEMVGYRVDASVYAKECHAFYVACQERKQNGSN